MKYCGAGRCVDFSRTVVERMESYRQLLPHQHEAGGILLGRWYGCRVVVEAVSEPTEEESSGRYFFERSVAKAQRLVKKAWRESHGEVIYLGEWHTHPESLPSPSHPDTQLIANMLRDSKMEIDFLFMAIVGLCGWYVGCQSRGRLYGMTGC